MTMFDLIRILLSNLLSGQNQFTTGGLMLMMIGGLGVYLRVVPQYFLEWLVEQTTMTITVKDDDAAFKWIKEWFLERAFLKRIRRVDLDTTIRGEGAVLIPAPGRHRFWYGKRPFWVWFYRSGAQPSDLLFLHAELSSVHSPARDG